MRSSPLIALICFAALVAAACTNSEPVASGDPSATAAADSAEGDSDAEPSGNVDGGTPDTSGNASSQTGGFEPDALDWSACDSLECAMLSVPLDYSDPDGDQIEIALNRIVASGADRIGSVLVNPGGPGASGLEYLQLASLTLPADLFERFDVVGFDPRGVGASSSIDCETDLDDNVELIAPGDDAAWAALLEEERQSLAGCVGLAIAPYVGTNNAARDMDVIRAALGDDQLTFIGYSYGTRLGATYAELFPENVRALVLDASVLPDNDLFASDKAQAAGFDQAFDNFANACDVDPDCILQELGPAAEVFLGVREEIEQVGSLPVDGGRSLNAGEFDVGVFGSLYSVSSWPILAEGLYVADTLGDGSILQFLADSFLRRQADGTYSNLFDVISFINCADDPNRPSEEQVQAQAFELGALTEYFPGTFSADTRCLLAPDPIDPLIIGPADGAPPILVIGNTGDPATPYASSVALADSLSSGVLYTVEAEGHTAYGTFDCVETDVTAYLVDLTVPTTTTCSENATADFFPPTGEGEIDLIIGFFDCLIAEGIDLEPITTADILADPTGEALFADVDMTDPDTGGAILACQSFLLELS